MMVPNLLWKQGSQRAYSACDQIWVTFLDRSMISHVRGSITQDLQEGWLLSRILQGFLAWLNTPGSKDAHSAYAVTTYRQRIAAAIGLQRVGGHHLVKAALSLVHRTIKGYMSTHIPKEKVWLTDTQYRAIVSLAWQDAKATFIIDSTIRDGHGFYCREAKDTWTLLWVLMATVEPVYRLTNILPETSREAHLCHFNLDQVRFREWFGEERLRMRIPEKCSRTTFRTVSLKTAVPNRKVWTRDYGSLFEVHEELMTLYGLDPSKATGRLMYKSKFLTASRYRTWLRELATRAGARPLGPIGLPVHVTPAIMRRTAIAKIYRDCGPTRTKVMVGHRGSKTAESFYLGFSAEEVSNFSDNCPHNFFCDQKLGSYADQRKMNLPGNLKDPHGCDTIPPLRVTDTHSSIIS